MQTKIEILSRLNNPLGVIELITTIILIFCGLIIGFSIFINFIEAKNNGITKKEKKSVVETGTMALFFLAIYLLVKFQIGTLSITDISWRITMVMFGLLIIIIGTFFNVWGRLNLGNNWANQIKIYKNQTLVNRGAFGIVRHPLYASLIWIYFGISLIYLNVLVLLANVIIFIPFMYYRAKQEEKALKEEFPKYSDYQSEVGMFFPKIGILRHGKF